jgi:hypothetical protein
LGIPALLKNAVKDGRSEPVIYVINISNGLVT